MCIQETKLQSCDDFLCSSVWGPASHAYSYRPSIGASGGLLLVWDTSELEVWASVSGDHFLMIHGRFIKSSEEFYLFNVYAPCDYSAKQVFWSSLSAQLELIGGQKVCVCEDFNVVRCREERCSVRGGHMSDDFVHFNRFIDDNFLVYLPLCGCKLTWFKGDKISMSRLDRFLLYEAWCLSWPDCLQISHLRGGLSDHCPILLSVDDENWRPRPTQ